MEQQDYEELGSHAQITQMANKSAADSAVASQYYVEEKEKGIVDIQLEVDSIKADIYHLLKQDRLVLDKATGQTDWKEAQDKDRSLTDWGVERIMQTIHFYINKNTLLTNFDEKQIKQIMYTFMKEINDLVLLKYEYLFREPTFDECKDIIKAKVDTRKKMKMFTLEVLGKIPDEEQITKDLMFEFEKTIEEEMNKIKLEKRKEKIREYGLLIAQLEVIVYATLNRAFRGEERGSIRRHTQISELIGGRSPLPSKSGGMFSWGSK